jgi:hypothetical protein
VSSAIRAAGFGTAKSAISRPVVLSTTRVGEAESTHECTRRSTSPISSTVGFWYGIG